MSNKAITTTEEVRDILTSMVPEEKVNVQEKPDGDVLKAHTVSLSKDDFYDIHKICEMGCEVRAKRSGVGITLIIKTPANAAATV